MMSNTYCGNNCEACREKYQHNCPGCQEGGTFLKGDCPIVDCARAKGAEHCSACQYHENCPTNKRRDNLFGNSRKTTKLVGMAKWLTLIGVFRCVDVVISRGYQMTEPAEVDPSQLLIPTIIDMIPLIIQIVLLYMIQGYHDKYRSAAKWMTVGAVVLTVVSGIVIFGNNSDNLLLNSVFLIANLVCSVVGLLHFWAGNREVLAPIDKKKAEKWNTLGAGYLISNGAIVLGIVTMFVALMFVSMPFATIGSIVMLAGAISLLVFSIIEIVYVFRMASFLRSLQKNV